MLILKLLIVPLFIVLVTLAGRKWGTQLAGILGGLPVVAGPIVVILAIEQGQQFGTHAATSAISAVLALMTFGLAYCWMSLKYSWIISFIVATLCWLITANFLAYLPNNPNLALVIAITTLLLAPYLLPKTDQAPKLATRSNDLHWRMLAGALLTLMVTQSALILGGVWSGILAVFPVIGSILAIFTHKVGGAKAVVQLYRGMIRGLYSLALFFFVLAWAWQHLGFWLSIGLAVMGAILWQGIMQCWLIYSNKFKMATYSK